MQSQTGMWITLEDADPRDVESDSTQRAISALIKFDLPADASPIIRACGALEKFILTEAEKWAKAFNPVWPWISSLDGLVAAGLLCLLDICFFQTSVSHVNHDL
ncbi:MAG: hypothetical protein NDF56_05375 [archaeon GB-1845-036]|nr:hypothetical protein [Candidatus Culexmicrobium thermophilum]